MSYFSDLYIKAYNLLCGQPPNLKPWHFQWLAVKDLYSDLRRILPTVKGSLLDVGCGEKNYAVWLDLDKVEHMGIDIYQSCKVDFVIKPDDVWPLPDNSFDNILCTQVLEHSSHVNQTIEEINRVLKPGGMLILSVPFIYNQHGAPDDYRRFSVYGVKKIFEPKYENLEIKVQGGIGSSIGTLFLNWVETQVGLYKTTRFLKGFLLPVWLVFCAFINLICWILDRVDRTDSFYSNTWLIGKKRCS